MTDAFASALRAAIRASGLSLEGIARRLGTMGVTVSVGTLSNWQSGRNGPSRQESLRAVGLLEEVLGLAPGSLHRLVRSPHLRGRPVRESKMTPIAAGYERGDAVRELLAQVDMTSDEQLMRISQHDRVRVGADRSKESVAVRQILRAAHDGPDRWVIAFWHDDEEPVPEEIRAIRGCTLGKTVVDRSVNALVAELLFDRPLARGETVVTEHEFLRFGVPCGASDSYGRVFRQPTRECLIEVDFHPAAMPVSCLRVATPDGDEPPSVKDLRVDSGVHALVNGFGPGVFEIKWSWDS